MSDSELLSGVLADGGARHPISILAKAPSHYTVHSNALSSPPFSERNLSAKGALTAPTFPSLSTSVTFSFDTLFDLVMVSLTGVADSPEVPSVEECGFIASFLRSEVERIAADFDDRRVTRLRSRVDELCHAVLSSGATPLPVPHIARFMRSLVTRICRATHCTATHRRSLVCHPVTSTPCVGVVCSAVVRA